MAIHKLGTRTPTDPWVSYLSSAVLAAERFHSYESRTSINYIKSLFPYCIVRGRNDRKKREAPL